VVVNLIGFVKENKYARNLTVSFGLVAHQRQPSKWHNSIC
jgi:hypothetical protein